MQYPPSIKFIKTDDGIRLVYLKDLIIYNPDIWAISYLLNEEIFYKNKLNIIHLDVLSITMALRLHFLPSFFENIKFECNKGIIFKEKAQDILNNIGTKYITYDKKSYDFSGRETKQGFDSLIEKNIYKNLAKFFKKDFSESNRVIRHFPADIFEEKISDDHRMGEKFLINSLTINNFEQLSVIYLKAKDTHPLDALAQAIDCGIFCYLFKEHIVKGWFDKNENIIKNKIAVYFIAEKFHPGIRGDKGVKSLIRKNDLFDIVMIEIKVKNHNVAGNPEFIFNTRKL